MKLTFDSSEIEQALISYVSTQGIDLADKNVTVSMTAGRGPNGHTAELDITTKKETNLSAIPTPVSTDSKEAHTPLLDELTEDSEPDDTESVFA